MAEEIKSGDIVYAFEPNAVCVGMFLNATDNGYGVVLGEGLFRVIKINNIYKCDMVMAERYMNFYKK